MSTKRTAAIIDASNAASNPSLEGIDVLDLTGVTGGTGGNAWSQEHEAEAESVEQSVASSGRRRR
jgi:hypothetical protein